MVWFATQDEAKGWDFELLVTGSNIKSPTISMFGRASFVFALLKNVHVRRHLNPDGTKGREWRPAGQQNEAGRGGGGRLHCSPTQAGEFVCLRDGALLMPSGSDPIKGHDQLKATQPRLDLSKSLGLLSAH